MFVHLNITLDNTIIKLINSMTNKTSLFLFLAIATILIASPLASGSVYAEQGKEKLFTNDGPPSKKLGEKGNIYINTANLNVYLKEKNSWILLGNLSNGAGIPGAPGADGATGPTGADGTNGTNGNDGATGPTGADGTNGTNGNDGATGADGANGSDGATGPTGADGTNGTNGNDGATGPTGAPATFTAQNCTSGQVMTGITSDGTIVCS
jgi:hypothetical protein